MRSTRRDLEPGARINQRIDGALTSPISRTAPRGPARDVLRRAKAVRDTPAIRLSGHDASIARAVSPGGGTACRTSRWSTRCPRAHGYGVECPKCTAADEVFTVEQMVERYYADGQAIAAEGPSRSAWSLGGYTPTRNARRMRAARPAGRRAWPDDGLGDHRRPAPGNRAPRGKERGEFMRGHFAGDWEYLDDAERERQRVHPRAGLRRDPGLSASRTRQTSCSRRPAVRRAGHGQQLAACRTT